jgi:RNA polymerase sigma-70 factor (ECF subfamily)
MPANDNLLFSLVKQDNKSAFDTLFRKYYVRLCRFAYQFLLSKPEAEEIVQEVFVRLWEQRLQISINTSFLAYLFTSVRNQSMNELKKNKIRRYYEDEFAVQKSITDEIPIDNSGEERIKRAIERACRQLPPKCREIFELSRNDGLTYEEIAEYLSLSKKTVENQMAIAFQKLRQQLEPYLLVLWIIFCRLFLGDIVL